MSTVDLYSPKDKLNVRNILLKEQYNKCAVSGADVQGKEAVLDHRHDAECVVRGVLHRQVNSFVGVIENAWKRYLAWWYQGTLPDLLRSVATFLEKTDEKRWRHDSWLKRLSTDFNSLTEGSKKAVLQAMNQPEGSNGTERKKLFKAALMTRKFTFEGVRDLIKKEKA